MFDSEAVTERTTPEIDPAVKQVFDATPVAMILSRPDGSFEYVNPALKQMLGYGDDIYDDDIIISHPNDFKVNREIRQSLSNNPFSPIIIEKRYLHKDGHVIPGLLTMVAEPNEAGQVKRFIAQVIDLTERKKVEESLWRLTTLLNQSNDAVMVIDPDSGRILDCNEPSWQRLGYSKDELLSLQAWDINQDLPSEKQWQELVNQFKRQGSVLREGRHTRKDGSTFPIEGSISFIQQSQSSYLFAVIRDISLRKENEALIWQQANYDSLTNLPNRRLLKSKLNAEIENACVCHEKIAVLYMDIDRFKDINDTLGHSAGDALLVEATQRLKGCIRHSDTLARLGGDEFTILLAGLESTHAAKQTSEQVSKAILSAFEQPFNLNGDTQFVSMSIGVSFYPDDGKDVESLFKSADQAMYAAKAQGRNNFQYFTQSMQKTALDRVRLVRDLRVAILEKQFELVYQPIIDLRTNKLVKAEALLRWQHPKQGMITPDRFIPVAEETGLIVEIGDWAFRQAAQQVQYWREHYKTDLNISINSSPIQYRDHSPRMNSWLGYMAKLGLPERAVSIEVTEGVLMDSSNQTADKLAAFHAAGIRISLDDFGTGYSSLGYLKKYAIDFIKIDQSFVRNLSEDSDDLALCEAIIVMAHKLGIQVIAEGIENDVQQELLNAAGCDFGQGYLYSKPISADKFSQLLHESQ